MMKEKVNYKSRFRLLKGGRISLVVSGLLVGASISTPAIAADYNIFYGVTNTTQQVLTATTSDSLTIHAAASGDPAGILELTDRDSVEINLFNSDSSHSISIENNGEIIMDGGGSGGSSGIITSSALGTNPGVIYSSTITNSGSIHVNQTFDTYGGGGGAAFINTYGINIKADMSDTNITNSGTISVTNIVDSVNNTDKVVGIKSFDMLGSSTITNSNTLEVTAGNSLAYGIALNKMDTNTALENSGEITATADKDAFGINIGDDFEGSITNNVGATISAETSGLLTEKAVGINLNFTYTGSSITNSGLIEAIAPSVFTDSGENMHAIGINAVQDMYASIVNNSGATISAYGLTAKGIYLKGDLNDVGTITNNGTIQAEGGMSMGFEIDNGSLNGSMVNSGTIEATAVSKAYGILVDNGLRGTIENSGTIDVTSTYFKGYGMYLYGDIYGTVHNKTSGTISVTASDRAYGITLQDETYMKDTASIINDGTMSVNSTDNGAVGIDAENMYDTSSIINNGNISVSSTGDRSVQSVSVQYMKNASSITNNGIISASSTNDVATGFVIGEMQNSSSITNNGTITAIGNNGTGGANGMYVRNMRGTSSIINNATISASSTDGNAKGLYIYAMYDTASITNSGTITVNSDTNDAVGLLVGDAETTNSIINSGTIRATKNDELDKEAFSIASFSNATFTNTSDGKLYGNILIKGSLTNSGTINLPHNANGVATQTAIANFTNSGTLEIGLLTDGTTTTHSQLYTGNATFANGSTINVNVLEASTNVNLLAGQTLDDVVIASNSLTIDGTLNITDNSALLNFEYVEDGETIDLNVVEAKTIFDSAVLGGAKSNAKKSAKVLQSINDNIAQYPQMTSVMSALNGLSTDAAVAQAVESTTPQTTGATVGAASQISNGIAGIVEQRQNIVMGGGLNSGDEMFANKNAWVKPFGSFGSQDDKDGINGFDVKAYGIGMGIDGEIKPNQTLGFAFFYTSANVDVNNVAQKSNLDVFTTLVYGNTPIIDEKTKFLYQLGYAWQKTNGERSVFTGDIATSDYTSKTASLDLKLVRDYKINDSLLLQPIVSATYRHFTNPAYSETGAGLLSLDIQKFTSTELIGSVGTFAYYKLDNDSKLIGNVNVGYDFHDKQQSVTASYQGASGVSFDTDGIDNGRWSYEAGIGYEKNINENSNINFSYNYQAQGSSFANNTVSAKYVLKF